MKLNTEDPCPLPDVELKFDGFSLDGISNCTVDGSSLVFNSLDLNYVNKFGYNLLFKNLCSARNSNDKPFLMLNIPSYNVLTVRYGD